MIARQEVLAEARRWIGTPYRHQASALGIGADCLGLIRGVWRNLIGTEPEQIPAYTADWSEPSGEEALLAAAFRWLREKCSASICNARRGRAMHRPASLAVQLFFGNPSRWPMFFTGWKIANTSASNC